jgi:ice-binding like protein
MTGMSLYFRRMTRCSIIVPLAAIVLNASAASAQSPLGSAQSFGVLGATTVTNTGPTVVTGDLGVSPGTAITGFPPGVALGGAVHAADLVAAQAQADAGMANARLRAMACTPLNNLSGQVLGTDVLMLPPGVYCFNTSAQLTGTLSLTGAGPWVFQVGSTLTTASNSAIVVVDAGQNCSGSNVFWQVGSSATLGTGTRFAGNVLALASITATTGVSVTGSLLALTGAVTMDTNNISVCSSGAGGVPPDLGKCEERHDKDGDSHDTDKDHKDKDNDKDRKDNDRKDKDRESTHKKRG